MGQRSAPLKTTGARLSRECKTMQTNTHIIIEHRYIEHDDDDAVPPIIGPWEPFMSTVFDVTSNRPLFIEPCVCRVNSEITYKADDGLPDDCSDFTKTQFSRDDYHNFRHASFETFGDIVFHSFRVPLELHALVAAGKVFEGTDYEVRVIIAHDS